MERNWRTRLARASLGIAALTFLGFGAWFLLRPGAIDGMGVLLGSSAARTEIRAMYGGLEVGLGVFFGISALRTSWLRPALFGQMTTLGGLAAGRIVGMVAEGVIDPSILLFTALELAGAALALVATLALLGDTPERSGPPAG